MDRLAISYRAEGVKIGGPGGQHEEIDVIAIKKLKKISKNLNLIYVSANKASSARIIS